MCIFFERIILVLFGVSRKTFFYLFHLLNVFLLLKFLDFARIFSLLDQNTFNCKEALAVVYFGHI